LDARIEIGVSSVRGEADHDGGFDRYRWETERMMIFSKRREKDVETEIEKTDWRLIFRDLGDTVRLRII
jgi:hypothetical protein